MKLPIETGRWKNISRENKICNLCDIGDLGDEFHFLFKCSHFNISRKQYLQTKFTNRPDILALKDIMNCDQFVELTSM